MQKSVIDSYKPIDLRFVLLICCVALHSPSSLAQQEISYTFEIVKDELVPFLIVGSVAPTPNATNRSRTREVANCLANLPRQHQKLIPPIYVVPALPGGRNTGGGFYPVDTTRHPNPGENVEAWFGKESITGVSDELIQSEIDEGAVGIVAVTKSAFEKDRRKSFLFSVLHEVAHGLQEYHALVPPGTRIERLGQNYRRNGVEVRSIREHAAQAYSRYILVNWNICTTAGSYSSVSRCTRAVKNLLRDAPAFENVSNDWTPSTKCWERTEWAEAPFSQNKAHESSVQRAIDDKAELSLIGLDNGFLVFNREAFRDEVSKYIWGGKYDPTDSELYPNDGYLVLAESKIRVEVGDTHWWLAEYIPGFNDSQFQSQMDGSFIQQRDRAPTLTNFRALEMTARPTWIPTEVWRDVLALSASSFEGIKRYSDNSPIQTDIVVVFHGGRFGAYAEMIEDTGRLYDLSDIVPPKQLELITGQSTEQSRIRWYADANKDYNAYMLSAVKDGKTVRQAKRDYVNHAHRELVITVLKSTQRGIDKSSKPAEASVAAFQFIWGLISNE